MNRQEATELRDTIRETGAHAVLSRDGAGVPPRWAVKICAVIGDVCFLRPDQWEEYKRWREASKVKPMPHPRNPIEAAIDAACGITEADDA